MRPRILVVDDSLTIRMDLRTALTTAGYLVTTCGTLASAQSWLDSHPFDLAILDVLLPDGSGISLLQRMRDTAQFKATPVIVLSTMAEVKSRIHGLQVGADRYIGKPYDRVALVRAAHELVKLPEPGATSHSKRPASKKKKLLIVDDCPTFINSLAAVFSQDGYEVVLAYSGEDAIELLKFESFDGVLIDLVLPGIDGIETCKRLRAKTGMDQTVVVVMTASENRRADALAAGADDLVVKSDDCRRLTIQMLCLFITKRSSSSRSSAGARPVAGDASMSRAALLYQHIIAASGLSALIAKPLFNRIFTRLDIDPAMITPTDLAHALEQIHQTLRIFLSAGELVTRMAGMAALVPRDQFFDSAAEPLK